MSTNVYKPSELDSELAIYGRSGVPAHYKPDMVRHYPRTAAAVSVDDDSIYHPNIPVGYEESTGNVKSDDLAELSKFWIALGIPPAERDNAYVKVIEDAKLLNQYLDRLAILTFYHQKYRELFAEREKCKAHIKQSLSGTQSSRHDLTVLLLSLRNLTLRLFTLVNVVRTICQKPVLFPSMKLAAGKGYTIEDDWVAYIKEEAFLSSDVVELIFIVLKFFPNMTPSAINEKVIGFFTEALASGRVLFGKHLLGSASSGYKDGQDMAMTSSRIKPSADDTLCEVMGYSRPLTVADISLHLILGINFETDFPDRGLPQKWFQQLEKRSGGSIVSAFQYTNDTPEPPTLPPEVVWDMVKCEGIVRDNFILIASKQEKRGQRTVVVPISGENTWHIPESYNLTSTVTPMFSEVQVRQAPEPEVRYVKYEQQEKQDPQPIVSERSVKSTKSTKSARSDYEVSAINPNIRTPHDSSIFIDAIEDNRGCYAAYKVMSSETKNTSNARVPPNKGDRNLHEVSDHAVYSHRARNEQEVIFVSAPDQRPESHCSATNESGHSKSAYATNVPDEGEWTPARGPRRVEKSEKVKEQVYTVYDPNTAQKSSYTTLGKDNFPRRRNSKVFMQGLTGSGLEEVGSAAGSETPKMKRRGSKVFMDRIDSTGSLNDEQVSAPVAGTPKMKRRGSKVSLSTADDETPSKLKRRGSKVMEPKEAPSPKPGRRNSKVLANNKAKDSTPETKSRLTESDLRPPQPIENYTIERVTEEELAVRARAVANDPVSYLRDPSQMSTTEANDPVFVLCDPSAFSHEYTDPTVKIVQGAPLQNVVVNPAAETGQPSNQGMGMKAYANTKDNRVGPRPANTTGERTVMMTDDIFRTDYSEVSANTSMAHGPEHPSDAGIVFLASLKK